MVELPSAATAVQMQANANKDFIIIALRNYKIVWPPKNGTRKKASTREAG